MNGLLFISAHLLPFSMKSNKTLLLIPFIALTFTCQARQSESIPKVKTGAEILIGNFLSELKGKRVGLVMNHSARVNRTHMLDTLISHHVNITALFAPEHGFRGDFGAGEIIKDGVDQETGLRVYSLYGSTKKPTKEMLENVDILLFDMQDVGARFYTYNSTLKYILEAGAEFDKEVWVLDRPNPAGGDYVAGWILEEEFESFVGVYPIPIAHGLTLGELAQMAISENWLDAEKPPILKVIKMDGWKRIMKWPETGLDWLPPSPNLPTFEHAFVYLGTCLFEGTTMSEGRGTPNPFLTIGSPTMRLDTQELQSLANKYSVKIDTISFVPTSIPGKSSNPKYEDQKLMGVSVQNTPDFEDPVSLGVELLKLMMDASKEEEYKDYLYLLSGTKKIENNSGTPVWGDDFNRFIEIRKKYLLYN